MDIEWIKEQIRLDKYEYSAHAEYERQRDKIPLTEVETAIINGEVLEDYPTDLRGASCLILGYASQGYPIHIVCGTTKANILRIITVYIPTLPKWIDARTRRRQ